MLPIWIIDLGNCAASARKLRSLLDASGDSLKSCWHYFCTEDRNVSDAASCKEFMDLLVSDGRACYNAFSKAGYNVGNFQIIIVGAADEKLSRSIFAPLPGLIRDNLPRIISDHANLGVEITGILFVPSTLNQLDSVQERTASAMLLEDVNMLCEQLGSRHFNRVVAYQDIQYKGNRFYSGLDSGERAELLFQILTNLFFAGGKSEKLFDRIGRDSGIFSLGAASIYYNSGQHRGRELKRLLDKLIAEFREPENVGREYSGKFVREVLEEDVLSREAVSARLREGCGSLDIDRKKLEEKADPHPVWELFRADLLPNYYRKYLKFMPARLMRFMQSLSYVLLTKFSGIIHNNMNKAAGHFKTVLSSFYRKVLMDAAVPFSTIAQLESVFNEAKEYLQKKSAEVAYGILEIVPVPEYLRNDYDKCAADEASNKPSLILEDIRKNIRKEPVVLSMAVRCFFLGMMLVFIVIPVLKVLSPNVVNLGKAAVMEWLWIPVLFFMPLVISLFIRLRRHFKRVRRLKYRLMATTLFSANKRLSGFLADEQVQFYEILAEECDWHLKRLADFRETLLVPEPEAGNMVIPETKFNQPLLGGEFCGERLLENESSSEASIRVKDERLMLSQLEKDEILSLLKVSFRQPETLDAADLSDGSTPVERHTECLVSVLGEFFSPRLDIHTADNIGRMLAMLGKDVNVAPFEKMAGVNGMLFSVYSNNLPVLRMTDVPGLFENTDVIPDEETADYAMLTCWQQITHGIQARQVCNCSLEPLPELSFADKLSLYYGYYRRKDLAYSVAGTPVRISKEDMDRLDKEIIGG